MMSAVQGLELSETEPERGGWSAAIEEYGKQLSEKGYRKSTLKAKASLLEGFGVWAAVNGLRVEDIDEGHVAAYVKDRKNTAQSRTRSALGHFCFEAGAWETATCRKARTNEESEADAVARVFGCYLKNERGLRPSTEKKQVGPVRRFLQWRFGAEPVSLNDLKSPDFETFILESQGSKRALQVTVRSLRCFLRYLWTKELVPGELSVYLPTIPCWRTRDLPRYLANHEVEQLLDGCERETSQGKRNYAILLLLVRLGLRAEEVATLSLDDIDWEKGEIRVAGKRSTPRCLPLLKEVGVALAGYLVAGRPPCSCRRVMITSRPPYRGFSNSSSISTMVKRCMNRAGLKRRRGAAHLLRHTLATQLIRNNANLQEIGQILGHQLQSTTEVYIRLDTEHLREIAQPWPGGVS